MITKTFTIDVYEFNLLSHENKMVESQELTNKQVNIGGQTKTIEVFTDICYVKNMTDKSIE